MGLRTLLIEDQKMFAQLLEGILRTTPGLEMVGTCSTSQEGLEHCERHRPDLLILDLQLPDGNGVAVARQLLASNPVAKIIILSGHANTFIVPPDLQDSIHAVIDKTKAYSTVESQINSLINARGIKTGKFKADLLEKLTEREQEIFEMIGKGRSNREIASHFGLSEHTVKTHRKRIATKLNLRGAALIHKATLATRRPAPQLA